MTKLAVLLAAVMTLSGCAGLAFAGRANGAGGSWIYADTKANDNVTELSLTPAKTGEACSTSILGLVTTGDSTVTTAAKAGGIKKVSSVDNTFMQVLGVYAKFCVVVTGE